jgi:hypothetical protein
MQHPGELPRRVVGQMLTKKMIRLLRMLLLPTAAFVIIAGLAWGEWSKILRLKRASEIFYRTSQIRVFKDVGEREWQGRPVPTYEYQVDGEAREFPTHSEIDLPADGRVRMGPDPLPPPANPFSQAPEGEWVVPINGPDSPETIYKGLRGHGIGEDVTKASLVSIAAIVAGIAGFFLQRLIFRDVGRALRSR